LTNSDTTGQAPAHDALNLHSQKPPPFRSVLTRPVLISLTNYATLALLGMISIALIPLIWSTPVEFGGLSLSSASIGLCMSVYGCMNGIFQFAVFPYVVGRFGPRSVFITSVAACAVAYVLFPFENLVLRGAADTPVVWLLIFVQLMALSTYKLGYSAIYMYISSATPNKRLLGAANGLGQSLASVQRTVAPAFADWLFAFSIANGVLGGNLVYVVLLALVGVGLYVAAQLPRHMWTHNDVWIELS